MTLWKMLAKKLKMSIDRLFKPPQESAEYRSWRQQFLLDRLKIALWIAVPAAILLAINGLFIVFLDADRFERDILRLFEDKSLFTRMRSQTLVNICVQFSVLFSCWGLRQSRWGRQHPTVIFLLLSSMLTWLDMVVGTCFSIPAPPDPRFFLAQAVLIPVHWRLHLLSQLVPIAHYAIVYPLFGLTKIGSVEFYTSYSINRAIELLWTGIICIASVYLYERLKRQEFESQRQLRSVIHAISHDLKTPVMGTSLILQGLLQQPEYELTVDRTILEQLLAGNERQLDTIASLQAAHTAEIGSIPLDLQPLDLTRTIDEIVASLEPIAHRHRMTLIKKIPPDLPLVLVDKTQLWRVFNNLIANAIKHNPPDTQIEIIVDRVRELYPHSVRCSIRDNGIGIAADRLPHLFELYTRGAKARRMPGLGLGLYLCKQIITAHQGEIGVDSQPDAGSTFWFTLPVAQAR
jgi:signal transduction histidine kinase